MRAHPDTQAKPRGRAKGFVVSAETRQRMSAAGRAAWADPAKRPGVHLRGLTAEQRVAYQLYRSKGFSAHEAAAAVRPKAAT